MYVPRWKAGADDNFETPRCRRHYYKFTTLEIQKKTFSQTSSMRNSEVLITNVTFVFKIPAITVGTGD